VLGLGLGLGLAAAAGAPAAPPDAAGAPAEPGAGTLPHAASRTDPSEIDNTATTAPGSDRARHAALRWPATLR